MTKIFMRAKEKGRKTKSSNDKQGEQKRVIIKSKNRGENEKKKVDRSKRAK